MIHDGYCDRCGILLILHEIDFEKGKVTMNPDGSRTYSAPRRCPPVNYAKIVTDA